MKGLTVIATNNGFDYLEEQLLGEKNFGRWPIVVVDTCSSMEHYSAYAKTVCGRFGVDYIRMDEPRYDFGAYKMIPQLEPYDKYDAYWFKHDSLYLKSPKFYDILEAQLPQQGFIGWHFFARWGSSFDNDEQRQWLIDQFGTDDYDYGFYGPNIAMKRQTFIDIYQDIKDVVVDTKMKQQAMERGWSIIGKKRKLPMMFLEQYKGDVQGDNYQFFRKAVHRGGPRQ